MYMMQLTGSRSTLLLLVALPFSWLAGCGRDKSSGQTVVVAPPPATAPAAPAATAGGVSVATTTAAALPKPLALPELGLRLRVPTAWTEGLAPAIAGPNAKLLRRADADLPALLVSGLGSKAYESLKTEAQTAGKQPFDFIAERMRRQILGGPETPSSTAKADAGRLISDKAWPSAAMARGRVVRYSGLDGRPDGTTVKCVVDLYMGEAASGSLYLLTAVAADENALDGLKPIVDSLAVSSVKE